MASSFAFPRSLPGSLRDPLLERDVLRLGARRSAFVRRTAAVAACGLFVLLAYGATPPWANADQVGQQLHLTFTGLSMLYVFAIALSESALAIPSERASGTLVVLLTVPRTPRRLAAGFLLSRVVLVLMAVLALLPLEGISMLLGSVAGRDLLKSVAAISLTAVYGAGLGFFAGHGAPTERSAVMRAGGLALILVLGIPALLLGMSELAWGGHLPILAEGGKSFRGDFETAAFTAASTTPAGLFLDVCSFGRPYPGSTFLAGRIPWIVALAATGWVLLALLLAGRRLRLETEATALADGGAGPLALYRRLVGRAARAAAPPRRGDRVWRWPLLWKESRPPRNAWVRAALTLFLVAVIAFMAWLWFSRRARAALGGVDEFKIPYDLILALPPWALLLAMAGSAGAFLPEERDRGTLDLLRVSPIPIAHYILCRPVGFVVRVAPFLAVLAFFGVVGILMGIVHPMFPVAWAAGTAGVAPFLVLLFFQRGVTAATVRVANRRIGAILLAVVVLFPFLVAFTADTLRWRGASVGMVLAFDPLASIGGPLVLLFERDLPNDHQRAFGIAGCVACLLWASCGWYLWRNLPRMLREGFHLEGNS